MYSLQFASRPAGPLVRVGRPSRPPSLAALRAVLVTLTSLVTNLGRLPTGLIVAVLILAVVSELLREAKVIYHQRWLFQSDVASSMYLAVQMGISFAMMLLVMLFDFGVVVSACIGMGLGHWMGRKWSRR